MWKSISSIGRWEESRVFVGRYDMKEERWEIGEEYMD